MNEKEPTTRTMKISEVKSTLSGLVNEVYRGETRVLIEKSGIPVAALVSIGDLELLYRLDQQRAERRRVLEAMREPVRGVPAEEIEREAAKAVAEVRADRRKALEAISTAFEDVPLEEIERELARISAEERERRFAVIDQMREAFKDVPPEEIERNVVAIVRKIREADEATIRADEQVMAERRPA